MPPLILFCLLLFTIFLDIAAAKTNIQDGVALKGLMDYVKNTPPNWVGSDPCGTNWVGIRCTADRVTSISLSSVGLHGTLTGDIASLTQLETLDLSYNPQLGGTLPAALGNLKNLTKLILLSCGFFGLIPDSIGNLEQLVFLSLNNNRFTGKIPPSIGQLSNLYWLDLADNNLDGTIPVSDGATPGLDMLLKTKHFHFGQNQLSGKIPDQLFSSNMVLIHVLFESNKFTGGIPSTLELVTTLEVIRLDRNSLSGNVPLNLNNLTRVSELYLSNNELTGPFPDLSKMINLKYVDISNNSFNHSGVPMWLSTLESLTTIKMENTQLQGVVPDALFSLPQLQSVSLGSNQLNGTLNVSNSFSSQLKLIDIRNNYITDYSPGTGYTGEVILVSNPFCQETDAPEREKYCTIDKPTTYSTPLVNNCVPVPCDDRISSPKCACAYPYTGLMVFRAPSFSGFGNSSYYVSVESSLMNFFSAHGLPVDSVSLSNATKDSRDYLQLTLQIFPYGQYYFNQTGVSEIGFVFSNQSYKPPKDFGPYYFAGEEYEHFQDVSKEPKNSVSIGIIVGAAAAGSILGLLLICAGVYALRQKKRAEKANKQNNPFASWDSTKGRGDIPQLKGARRFVFEEIKKCTTNFSEANFVGCGGYGKVYKGFLPTGQLVAIKRAEQGSHQGGLEFKTELELLSRVHHKNVVNLVGFCFEQGEQMLIYEYIPNGSLKESLSGKSGIKLDWMRRLRVAVGAARGVAYLHELADPPIIHRDIKSNNILLDERLNAKVGDFGLSKLMGDSGKGHVSTQVKGTMGYLDPEYYMTQQLTEKSDVYSFGVLMLELVTAKPPIERGQYIVRVVKSAMDRSKELYNLQGIVDPAIGLGSGSTLAGLEKFVDLALRCVEEAGEERPTMGEVVKEIENIMQLAGLNPNAESASTSATYDEKQKQQHPYISTDDSSFDYSGGQSYAPPKIEPK